MASNKNCRKRGFKLLFLHAHKLQFAHPITGELLKITAPLPDDLQLLLDNEK